MSLDLLFEKKLSKPFYYLNQEGLIEVKIKNQSPYIIRNLTYQQIESKYYDVDYSSITLDGEPYIMGLKKSNIEIGELYKGEEVVIILRFKACDINSDETIQFAGKINYIENDEELTKEKTIETIFKGVKLEFKKVQRDKNILFGNDICKYDVVIENKGNVLASNIILKYLSSGKMITHRSEVTIDGVLYKGMFLESGINIGSLLKGEERAISFFVRGKQMYNSESSDYVEVFYEGVVNPFVVAEGRYIRKKLDGIVTIKNDIEAECHGEIYFNDNIPMIKKTITLKNNCCVDIENLILSEEIDFQGELVKVNVNKGESYLREGNTVIIPELLFNKIYDISLTYKIRTDVSTLLKLQSELIYNLGNKSEERRFKKTLDAIKVPLQINLVDISQWTSKDMIGISERFKREIKLKNLGNRKVERVILFDRFSERLSITNFTFKINDKRINIIENLEEGMEIGEIGGFEEMNISYEGRFLAPIKENVVKVNTYCRYKVLDGNSEVRDLKTKVIESVIGIESERYTVKLERELDIKKLIIKDITGIRVTGEIIETKLVRGYSENSKAKKVNINDSYLINGKLEINLDYTSPLIRDKIYNVNMQTPFREIIEGRGSGTTMYNRENIKATIKSINTTHTVDDSILHLLISLELTL